LSVIVNLDFLNIADARHRSMSIFVNIEKEKQQKALVIVQMSNAILFSAGLLSF
jgi:hypothetical protein